MPYNLIRIHQGQLIVIEGSASYDAIMDAYLSRHAYPADAEVSELFEVFDFINLNDYVRPIAIIRYHSEFNADFWPVLRVVKLGGADTPATFDDYIRNDFVANPEPMYRAIRKPSKTK